VPKSWRFLVARVYSYAGLQAGKKADPNANSSAGIQYERTTMDGGNAPRLAGLELVYVYHGWLSGTTRRAFLAAATIEHKSVV